MAVPTPPRLDAISTIEQAASAIRVLQTYSTQVYNAVRPAVYVLEQIAQLEAYTGTISNPPTQAEVTEINNRVTAILAASRLKVSGQ